jgi:uncharacterized membrane protein
MLIASISPILIKLDGSFIWVHLLAMASITRIALGLLAIRNGKVKMHRHCMFSAFQW